MNARCLSVRLLQIIAVITAGLSLAAAPGEALRVEWTAHDGCPGSDDFWREVVARSSKLRRPQSGEAAHSATVKIARGGEGSVASIVIDGGAPRVVSAETCAEAVAAAAVVTVVALDPDASSLTPSPSASSTSSSPSAAPAASAPSTPTPHAPTVDLPSPNKERSQPGLVPSLGLALGAMHAGAGAMLTTAVAVNLERVVGNRSVSSVRLSLDRGESEFVSSERGTGASFTWTTGRLDAMFVPWSLDRVLGVGVGVAIEGGVLQGRPSGVDRPNPPTRLWVAAYALSRLQWNLTGTFALELEGAVGTPYTRDEFVFEPGITVYRPSAAIGRARLGVLVRLP